MISALVSFRNYVFFLMLLTLSLLVFSQYRYNKGLEVGKSLQQAEYAKQLDIYENTKNQLIEETAKLISKIEVKNVEIYNKAVKEIIKEPVYTECIVPPSGLSSINEALAPK